MKKFETVQSAYDGGYPDVNGNVFSHGESVYIVAKADLDALEREVQLWKRKYVEAVKANGELLRFTQGDRVDEPEPKPCRQCYHGKADDDGFCSDSCMKQFDDELSCKQTREEEE